MPPLAGPTPTSNALPRVGAAAAEDTRTLPAGDPGIRKIAAWLKDLFDRTEILLRIARASQADQLRRLTFLNGYPSDRRACEKAVSFQLSAFSYNTADAAPGVFS